MGKRGAARRWPGDEPEFSLELRRAYRRPLKRMPLRDIDVSALRRKLNMSQTRFAHRFGFPVATLRHWELGNRKPRGAALALLHVIDCSPHFVVRAILRARRPP